MDRINRMGKKKEDKNQTGPKVGPKERKVKHGG
jgi:hypothetical protein